MEGAPVISARNFSKTFAGRTVLHGVDLDVRAGEIHGFLGQNGSGKSTLIKILSGFHQPDEGASLVVRGQEVPLPLRPGEARTHGMSFVHQDLALLSDMSVMENLRVGRFATGPAWRIKWRDERRVVREALEAFGVSLDPDTPVSALGEVERAMVAVVRALQELREIGGGLLVLDEPTPYLPRDGVERLFASVREVAESGVGVLFVTHRLEEVEAITDRVSVIRDGKLVSTVETEALSEDRLIEMILGFSLDQLYPTPAESDGEVVFSATGVSSGGLSDFSVEIRKGEIVGVTGLLGMGWERVPYVLFGAEPRSTGTMTINGVDVDLRKFDPARAIDLGFALLPANRLRDGGLGIGSVTENLTLPTLGAFYTAGVLRRRREERRVEALLQQYDVRPPDPRREFATLSGGNQQKVLVAKWLETQPKLLLLHEPTQGVDVGARAQIFQRLRDVASEGAGILLASSEYEDLVHLCDRVIVFRDGHGVNEVGGSELTVERLVEQSFRDEGTRSKA